MYQRLSCLKVSEKSEAKRINATLQRNSGRGPIAKGDAKWKNLLIDIKEYPKGFRVTPENWAKVCSDSFAVNRELYPALQIVMGDGNKKVRLGIVSWDFLTELINFYMDNNG